MVIFWILAQPSNTLSFLISAIALIFKLVKLLFWNALSPINKFCDKPKSIPSSNPQLANASLSIVFNELGNVSLDNLTFLKTFSFISDKPSFNSTSLKVVLFSNKELLIDLTSSNTNFLILKVDNISLPNSFTKLFIINSSTSISLTISIEAFLALDISNFLSALELEIIFIPIVSTLFKIKVSSVVILAKAYLPKFFKLSGTTTFISLVFSKALSPISNKLLPKVISEMELSLKASSDITLTPKPVSNDLNEVKPSNIPFSIFSKLLDNKTFCIFEFLKASLLIFEILVSVKSRVLTVLLFANAL